MRTGGSIWLLVFAPSVATGRAVATAIRGIRTRLARSSDGSSGNVA